MAKSKTRSSSVNPKKVSTATTKNAQNNKKSNNKKSKSTVNAPSIESTKKSDSEASSPISLKTAEKAVSELRKYKENEKKDESSKLQLFDEEEDDEHNLYLQVTKKKFFSKKPEFKPRAIKLSHSLYGSDQADLNTCLIIRDNFTEEQDVASVLENADLPTVKKIIPLKALKTEYKIYEKRRLLLRQYDLFLVDDALTNLMPTLLGKTFYKSSKFPIPIRVAKSSSPKIFSINTLKNQLEKYLSCTCYLPPIGVNTSIKIGALNSKFTNQQLADNIMDVAAAFNGDETRCMMLKYSSSPSLPLFYAEEIFSQDDVKDETKEASKKKSHSNLSVFEKGLLELGDIESAANIIGKRYRKATSSS